MKQFFRICAVLAAGLAFNAAGASAQEFNNLPLRYKWLSSSEAAFTYNGTFTDKEGFRVSTKGFNILPGVDAPYRFTAFPVQPEGAVNLTYSPDSTMLAFTRDNDLYVVDIASGRETRLTDDGTDLILNGYASWVYYEEILGRASRYKAFWWSPDSRKIGFYRFDNSGVPMFPIYSHKGQDGSLNLTRYPKCGEPNPQVRIGIVPVGEGAVKAGETVWADFDPTEDQYFGIPFWGADSREFFISREPRLQNTLDLYSVSVDDGSKKHIYHETYKTWLDWIEGMVFTSDGLYMVRSFETLWQQIYFLSYDGKTLRRLTDGPNWRMTIQYVDEKKGDVYFTAERDSRVRQALYKVDKKGNVTALTDPELNVSGVSFSPDGKYFISRLSNFTTPDFITISETARPQKNTKVLADMKGPDYDPSRYALPSLVHITTPDGFELPAAIVYPRDFDPEKKYPVHMDIYGGPDTPQVNDRFRPTLGQWWSDNGIIEIVADCRASGHNGRAGLDCIYRQLDVVEVEDFVCWAKWLKSLPYVNGDKIGVEGFSFGGTMTALLVMDHSDMFHYGIAGGGVYDWALYDTHYTERFMDTPQNNPEGYARTRAIDHAKNYPTKVAAGNAGGPRGAAPGMAPGQAPGQVVGQAPGQVPGQAPGQAARNPQRGGAARGEAPRRRGPQAGNAVEPVMLKITHGTGDDNVHFQNTLYLIDELQKNGAKFEFMIYPDGMHGYRGYQGVHFNAANREFWLKYLKN